MSEQADKRGSIFSAVLGRFQWTPPGWFSHFLGSRKKKPFVFWSTLLIWVLIVSGSIATYQYFKSLPGQVMVQAVIQVPELPDADVEKPEPASLMVRFKYDYRQLKADQERPTGEPSVARIDLVGRQVKKGISLMPAISGQWYWDNDRELRFTPDKMWPPGVTYSVNFDPTVFSGETHLERQKYDFKTSPFEVNLDELKFYQDPKNSKVHKVVSTLTFSHPVEQTTFKQHVKMNMRPSGSDKSIIPVGYDYTVTYSKNHRKAFIHSAPVSLPPETNFMTLSLSAGVSSSSGGNPSASKIDQQVKIPDITSFLRIENSQSHIVRNAKQKPEQVLTISFTDAISQSEIKDKLEVYLLPKRNHRRKSNYWRSPREVTEKIRQSSERLTLKLIPNQNSDSVSYSFKYDAPVNRYIYVYIKPGLRSVNQYVRSSIYDAIERTARYPLELAIQGDGAVLSLSSSRRLSVLSRGIDAYKVEIGRLRPGQINHLVSQTSGDFKTPYFENYQFGVENITHIDRRSVTLNPKHPAEANYSSLDLSDYLSRSKNKFGLFFIKLIGWNPKTKRTVGVSYEQLVLITDLGVVLKNNSDKSHELFVQSIRSGKPINGVNVGVLGKNGETVLSAKSDAAGHVSFPDLRGFKNERQPVAYVVQHETDSSFIPYQRYSRQIDYSRFDVGGAVHTSKGIGGLKAYLFTDRGIYKPGEKVRIAGIVRMADLNAIESIPLEITIRGPRSGRSLVKKFMLPAKGLFDYSYQTDVTADTGTYQAYVYLIKNKSKRRILLGSRSFKVETYQPDTLKITSRLNNVETKGWLNADELTLNVQLNNLFGAPAQDRRIEARLQVSPKGFHFSEYKRYKFIDPFRGQKKNQLRIDRILGVKKTDADGKAIFPIKLDDFNQGTYQLSLKVKGFDQAGGRSVSAANHALISPMSVLVGYKADSDLSYIRENASSEVHLIAINPSLEKIDLNDLKVRLIKYKNISTLVKQEDGTFHYQTVQTENLIKQSDYSISKTGEVLKLPTETPGDYLMEIVDAQSLALSYIKFSVIGDGMLDARLDKNTELDLKLSKKDYKAGEWIEMNIRAPYTGSGLITIESDKVHEFKWFKTTKNSVVERIQVPDTLEGNAYVNIVFVRDPSSPEIFTSPLSYAVEPFSIDRSKRILNINLDADELVRPGKAMKIQYRSSEPSKMLVFAVDEGILQVARYQTPDPLGFFMKKKMLDVTTMQMLDLILPDYKLLQQHTAAGGGAMGEAMKMRMIAKNLNPFRRKIDKSAVYWSGILDANSVKKSVSFTVPETFAGSLRIMAVAINENAMGASSRSSLVRGPFVISPNVLTQAAPGDRFRMTVGVSNLIKGSGKGKKVNLQIKTSANLAVSGSAKTILSIDEDGEQSAHFMLEALDKPGEASVHVSVASGDEHAKRSVSLSIRPAVQYQASFTGGYSTKDKQDVSLDRLLYPQLAKQKISASASPLVLVDGLSEYLKHFPHGCTEQVVSKMFPVVGLLKHPAYNQNSADNRKKFQYLMKKLSERQLSSGGFSFWPGTRQVAEFPSVYVMHFLLESRQSGYAVPAYMFSRGQDYLSLIAEKNVRTLEQARIRAMAIYLLTRLDKNTTNYLVGLHSQLEKRFKDKWEEDLTSVYMAATYQMLKKQKESHKLVSHYQLGNKQTDDMGDFFSVTTQDAQYVYLLAKHFPVQLKKVGGDKIRRLVDPLFKGQYNTISAAYSTLALGAYTEQLPINIKHENIQFSAIAKGKEKVALATKKMPLSYAMVPVGSNRTQIETNQDFYYLMSQSGYDKSIPDKELSQGLEVTRAYFDSKGTDLAEFKQGQEVTVRIKIRALGKKYLSNIAITDLLPGGFEVIRSSVPRTAYGWKADYVDVREDRLVFYGSFDSSVTELSYRAKVTSAGTFTVAPLYARSMYNRSILAHTAGKSLKVTASE